MTNSFNVPVNLNGTVQFYWNLTINSGTIQPRVFTQSITGMNIDGCTVGKLVVLNLTNYDQDTLTKLTNNNFFNVLVRIGDNQLTSYLQFASNFTNATHATVCLDSAVGSSLRMDYTVQWNKNNSYRTQYYNVQNQTLTNSSFWNNNISLYNILTANSQIFQINIRDSAYTALPNVVVKIDRQYLSTGTYLTAEAPVTDVLGSTIGNLILNNQIYNIYVIKNGLVLGSFINQQPYCNVLLTDCVINYNLPVSSIDAIDINNVVYYPSYNDSNRRYTLDFYTLDALPAAVTLNGIYEDFGTTTTVCTDSSTISVGTLTCTVPSGYENKTINFEVLKSQQKVFTDTISVGYQKAGLPNTRYLIAGLLVLVFVIMAASTGSVSTIIMFIIGLFTAGGLYLYDTQSIIGAGSMIAWIIVAGFILIVKITRGGARDG